MDHLSNLALSLFDLTHVDTEDEAPVNSMSKIPEGFFVIETMDLDSEKESFWERIESLIGRTIKIVSGTFAGVVGIIMAYVDEKIIVFTEFCETISIGLNTDIVIFSDELYV